MAISKTALFWALSSLIFATFAQAYFSYPNAFVDPNYILTGKYDSVTQGAQQSLVAWADQLNAQGPWSVMTKTFTPPSGDKHDYMSWSPYWWPDCSKVGNTTALTPEQVWTTCPYVNRDGQFNPDISLLTDNWSFQNVSDGAFYNALVWAFQKNTSSTVYSRSAVRTIQTWFLDSDTRMNPNLNYSQVIRGPWKWNGTHEGILDMKCMAKVASAILILREGNATDWTPDLDNQMVSWVQEYIQWLETATEAIQEGEATNNHGSYYYNQLASLQLIAKDVPGALNTTQKYFNNQYLNQINANGEQPLEIVRTRPYHYTAYNLIAMIVNAQLSTYAGNSSVWSLPTHSGATIQTALNYALTLNASTTNETALIPELTPSIGKVAVIYGDPKGKYVGALNQLESGWMSDGWVLWTQPLNVTTSVPSNSSSDTGGKNGALRLTGNTHWVVALAIVMLWLSS